MAISKINPQMNRNKALIIIGIIAAILLCAILIPDNGGAVKSISVYDEVEDATYTYSGDQDGYIDLDGKSLQIDGRNALIWEETDADGNLIATHTYAVTDGRVEIDGTIYDVEFNKFYTTFWALVPPIVAITLALITKEVYSSLFVGILMGGVLWAKFNFENTVVHVVNDGFI